MKEPGTTPTAVKVSPGEDSCELRYLLTAYLFDDLSEEGRLEVEKQLEGSEACRTELAELKETLSLLSEAIGSEAEGAPALPLDQERREKILSTSRRRPSRGFLRSKPAFAAAATLALFIGIYITARLTAPLSVQTDPRDPGYHELSDASVEAGEGSEAYAKKELSFQSRLKSGLRGDASRRQERSLERAALEQDIIADAGNSFATESPPPPTAAAAPSSRIREALPVPAQKPARDGIILADTSDRLGRIGGTAPKPTSASEPTEKDVGEKGKKKRVLERTPKILTPKIIKEPVIRRKIDEVVTEIPRGTDLSKVAQNSTIINDAIGVGGGAAGAYGYRYGKGRVSKQKTANFGGQVDPGREEGLEATEEKYSDSKELLAKDQAGELGKKRGEENSRKREKSLSGDSKKDLDKEANMAFSIIRSKPQNKSTRRLAEEMAQKRRPAGGLVYEGGNEANSWAYNLNIVGTEHGFLSLGNNAGRQSSGESRSSRSRDFAQTEIPERPAAGSPVAPAANLPAGQGAAGNDRQNADTNGLLQINEKTLNSFAFYRELDPRLSYEQFHSRALVIPPPALGDEGLGEKGFRRKYNVNPFVDTSRDHLSTFGMDVDNASWGRTRASIRNRRLPPPQTVRVEEFINNFPDERPGNHDSVFTVYTEGGPSPFGDHGLELLQITVKSRDLLPGERKNAILTFAVDTSGSMATDGKLDLLKQSIRTLVSNLGVNDRVAIVAFSTNAYVVLPHTSVRQKSEIDAAINSLVAVGGTNVEAGIDLAYRLAGESSSRRAANRVILCSDGVANLGARGPEAVLKRTRRFAQENLISLYTYAFGSGGRHAVRGDRMLQRLADEGDGRYQYVDSGSASRSIFSLPDQLQVLASDSKIQVDFNPDVVSHYRLLGYEKRDIADKDFRNDKVDAGEVGPGSTVTVIYEIKRSRPVGSLGRIFLRYRDTVTRRVEEYDFALPPGVLAGRLSHTSDRFLFMASVAEFAEMLRGSYYARNGSYGAILELMSKSSAGGKRRADWQEADRIISMTQGLCAVNTLNSIRD